MASKRFDFDAFDARIGESLDKYEIRRHIGRLMVLHELEDLAWEEVDRRKISADVAELAINDCITWVEEPCN